MPPATWPTALQQPLDAFIEAAEREYGALGVEPEDLRQDLRARILARLDQAVSESQNSALQELLEHTQGADLCLCLAWQRKSNPAWTHFRTYFRATLIAHACRQGAGSEAAGPSLLLISKALR